MQSHVPVNYFSKYDIKKIKVLFFLCSSDFRKSINFFFLEGPQTLRFVLLLGAAFRVKLERGGLTLTGESFKGQKSP